MTTLVTGGTGKTGLPLARLLLNSNQPFLLASRSGSAPEPFTGKGVRFDFFDKGTYENPFKADSNIDRAYIVNPVMDDPYEPVTAFIDFAKSKGVKRFVLLLGTPFTKVHTSHGRIWGHLENLGVEYTVLNATYFTGTHFSSSISDYKTSCLWIRVISSTENISTVLRTTIRDMNSIITAAGDGKVPFVGVDDVAQAAYDALFAENSPNTDYIVIGPSLYTYDEVRVAFYLSVLALCAECTQHPR